MRKSFAARADEALRRRARFTNAVTHIDSMKLQALGRGTTAAHGPPVVAAKRQPSLPRKGQIDVTQKLYQARPAPHLRPVGRCRPRDEEGVGPDVRGHGSD